MMSIGPQTHTYEVNAMLQVSESSQKRIEAFFIDQYGVKPNRLQSYMHLTVYHGRRPIPGLHKHNRPVRIIVPTAETRFMVLVPGGENPLNGVDPRSHSVGIRLTKRNPAIPEIQQLRRSIYCLETEEVIGTRKPTTAWTNCFGSRHYQPHIQLLRPWHKANEGLKEIGLHFRSEIDHLVLDLFNIEFRHRDGRNWVVKHHM